MASSSMFNPFSRLSADTVSGGIMLIDDRPAGRRISPFSNAWVRTYSRSFIAGSFVFLFFTSSILSSCRCPAHPL